MIINISDVWAAAVNDHAAFLDQAIEDGLAKLGSSIVEGQVAKFIAENRRIIVYGQSAELADCIQSFLTAFSGPLLRACAVEKMKLVFDYSSFSEKSARAWTAYDLCSRARYKVCCYCHMIETGTCLPDEEIKGYRPPIDHYYGKADYPFLALSLYNFIPCCEKCNGPQMKGQIDFSVTPHLNPLLDEESIDFSLGPIAAAADKLAEFASLTLPKDQYKLEVSAVKNLNSSSASIKTFQLRHRYGTYSERAYYLAKRVRGLASRRRFHDDELDFKIELEEHLEFKPDEYKGVPYGKARVCVARQFGRDLLP